MERLPEKGPGFSPITGKNSFPKKQQVGFPAEWFPCQGWSQMCFLYQWNITHPQSLLPTGCVHHCPCCRVNSSRFPWATGWQVRKACFRIVEHSWFESFIVFMILLSSGALVGTTLRARQGQGPGRKQAVPGLPPFRIVGGTLAGQAQTQRALKNSVLPGCVAGCAHFHEEADGL